jgi:hypothetical protein
MEREIGAKAPRWWKDLLSVNFFDGYGWDFGVWDLHESFAKLVRYRCAPFRLQMADVTDLDLHFPKERIQRSRLWMGVPEEMSVAKGTRHLLLTRPGGRPFWIRPMVPIDRYIVSPLQESSEPHEWLIKPSSEATEDDSDWQTKKYPPSPTAMLAAVSHGDEVYYAVYDHYPGDFRLVKRIQQHGEERLVWVSSVLGRRSGACDTGSYQHVELVLSSRRVLVFGVVWGFLYLEIFDRTSGELRGRFRPADYWPTGVAEPAE